MPSTDSNPWRTATGPTEKVVMPKSSKYRLSAMMLSVWGTLSHNHGLGNSIRKEGILCASMLQSLGP
eukprot:6480722-Amphidinium_carterae.1